MKTIHKGIFLLVLAFSQLSCNKGDVGIDQSLQFPALARGKFWIYRIDEKNIINGQASSSTYTQKEQIKDTLIIDKQVMYVVDISTKLEGQFDFIKRDTKLYYATPLGFFEKKGSSTILRLKYPVFANHEWFYNLEKPQNQENIAKYTGTKKEFTYGKDTFKDGFQLQVRNDSTGLFRKKNFEIYHPKLGLVISESIDEEYCQETPSCIGKGIIQNSKVIQKTLTDTN